MELLRLRVQIAQSQTIFSKRIEELLIILILDDIFNIT